MCQSFLDWVNKEEVDESYEDHSRGISAEYTYHLTLYTASNGLILELKRHDPTNFKNKTTLHFLNRENLGSQIEKILFLENIKN